MRCPMSFRGVTRPQNVQDWQSTLLACTRERREALLLAYLQRIAMVTLESEPLDVVVRVWRTLEIMSENRVTSTISN